MKVPQTLDSGAGGRAQAVQKEMKKAGGKEGATGARRQSQMLDDYRSATP
jgi:hypothetical protein